MKKAFLIIAMLLFAAIQVNAGVTSKNINAAQEVRLMEIRSRVHEIRSIGHTKLSKAERGQYRQELKELKKEVRAMHMDKELIAGIIIIIVGLLIYLI